MSTPPKASLEGPLAKLGRAHAHLEALYDELRAFTNTESHTVVVEEHPQTREFTARIKVLREPDNPGWGLIAGDFVNNLRAALDHLVCQLVILSGAKPGRDNQFPVALMRGRHITANPEAKVQMKAKLPLEVGFGDPGGIRGDGFGMLYEFVRDYLKSFRPLFGE